MFSDSDGDIRLFRYHKITQIWTPSTLVCTCSILVAPSLPSNAQNLISNLPPTSLPPLILWWMLRTLTKGWYLPCYKYRRRDYNVYPNILVKAAFFLENSTNQFNHENIETSKARKIFW